MRAFIYLFLFRGREMNELSESKGYPMVYLFIYLFITGVMYDEEQHLYLCTKSNCNLFRYKELFLRIANLKISCCLEENISYFPVMTDKNYLFFFKFSQPSYPLLKRSI